MMPKPIFGIPREPTVSHYADESNTGLVLDSRLERDFSMEESVILSTIDRVWGQAVV
jgi:hypothetical protein